MLHSSKGEHLLFKSNAPGRGANCADSLNLSTTSATLSTESKVYTQNLFIFSTDRVVDLSAISVSRCLRWNQRSTWRMQGENGEQPCLLRFCLFFDRKSSLITVGKTTGQRKKSFVSFGEHLLKSVVSCSLGLLAFSNYLFQVKCPSSCYLLQKRRAKR